MASRNSIYGMDCIEEHINYISTVIDGRINDSAKKYSLKEKLNEIVEKHNDKLLNMSVVGEFSTGKSTFINALLRTELLSSCALQGTTVSNTVIEYGDNYGVRVEYKNKKRVEGDLFSSVQDMSDRIEMLTTNPRVAREISSVSLTLPAENIKNNFRIIDTPGTNSLEGWHEEVTKAAINRLSDISIILVDASKPFPESFCNFVKTNLSNVLSRCVFVLTKFDIIRPKERKIMISYAKKKIINEFGIEEPVVLPYCATAVLECAYDSELYSLSLESEKSLVAHMARQKIGAQTEKLIHLVDSLYGAVENDMNDLDADIDARLRKLELNRQTNLAPFIKEQISIRLKELMNNASQAKDKIAESLSRYHKKCVEDILGKLDGLNNTAEIKQYIENGMLNDCVLMANKSNDNCKNMIKNNVDPCYYKSMKAYENAFEEHFRSLGLLVIESEVIGLSLDKNDSRAIFNINGQSAKAYLSEMDKHENGRTLGGAAAGAAIGTALLPGIGTVIGGVFGALFGGIFGPSINEIRQTTKNNLRPQLVNYFSSIESDILAEVNKYISETANSLRSAIDIYYKKYKDIVEIRIQDEQNKKLDLEMQKRDIKRVLREVAERKERLMSMKKVSLNYIA